VCSSGQSSWLQIQRSGIDSRHYHISWEVVGLEGGPPSLVSATEELLERKSSGPGLETWEYGLEILHADHVALFIRKKLALASLTSGGRSVDIVRLRTEVMEVFF
jgi:hypothetical protein